MGRIYIEIDKNDAVLYKQMGISAEVVITWLHKEIVKVLRETENIYGCLDELDEDLVAEAIIHGCEVKKKNRLKEYEKNRKEIEERDKGWIS